MMAEWGAFQEGKAAGYLNGETARNPYKDAALRDDWSALVECSSNWESGKIQGLAMRRRESAEVSR